MTQKRKNTSEQRSAAGDSVEMPLGSNFYDSSYFEREIFLDYEHWQNIAENKRPWYEYNQSSQDILR